MKLNLRASISPLFTSRKRSISEAAVSIKPKLHFSFGDVSSNKCHARFKFFVNSSSEKRMSHSRLMNKFWIQMTSGELPMSFSKYGVRGIQSLRHSLHSSSGEEDDFSELDLPMSEGGVTLVTEQPKASLSIDPSGRVPFRTPLPGLNNSTMKSLPLSQGNHKPALHFNVENHDGVSRVKNDAENAPKSKSSRSITIEKVPSTISLFKLSKALSIFGEISSMKTGLNGFNNCHFEFKTVEAKKRAVKTRWILVGGVHLQICSLHIQESITIRISNISADTAEPAIHLICMSCGPVEGLSRAKEGSVDVFFNANDTFARQGILKKLNDVFIDNCQWSAQLLPSSPNSTDMSSTAEAAQLRAGLQFGDLLIKMEKQFQMGSICLEDLVELHDAVMHLQDRPAC